MFTLSCKMSQSIKLTKHHLRTQNNLENPKQPTMYWEKESLISSSSKIPFHRLTQELVSKVLSELFQRDLIGALALPSKPLLDASASCDASCMVCSLLRLEADDAIGARNCKLPKSGNAQEKGISMNFLRVFDRFKHTHRFKLIYLFGQSDVGDLAI